MSENMMELAEDGRVESRLTPPIIEGGLTRDGFEVLRGFLGPADTALVRSLVESTLRIPHAAACTRPNNMLVPLRWNDPIVQVVLSNETRLRELANRVGADDLKWISGYISVKEPHSPALWWHSDWWCWDHPNSFQRKSSQVAVLTYLDDTSVANGALRVLPGSHHKSAPIHAILPEAHSRAAEGLNPEHEAMIDQPGGETLALNSGDAAVIDYRLLHGTHPNSTPARRDCILLSFTPSWERLPEDLRAHLIQHPALPSDAEGLTLTPRMRKLLPEYEGAPRSLNVNRNAPAHFETVV